jgi:uncharacterized membrane protein YfcA
VQWHDLVLVISAFGCEVLGALSGFGSSTFFVPVAQLIENFRFVLALTAFLHCFGNLSRIFVFHKNFNRSLFLKLAIPSIAFTGLGAVLNDYVDPSFVAKVLGVGLIFISGMMFFYHQKLKTRNLTIPILLSAISGFMTGFIGTGGAIRGVALASMNIESNLFVSLSSSIDVGGDFLRLLIYLKNGYMDWNQWFYVPLLAAAGYLGALVGKKILQRINQELFYRIVAVFVFIGGIGLLID